MADDIYAHEPDLALMLKAPAKVNLFLSLTGRDISGFHFIESFFCFTDDLHDEIRFLPTSESSHSVKFVNTSNEVGHDNTVTKVLDLFEEYIQDCFEITVVKNLPVSAGLGGGSADAAALLRYFGKLYRIPAPLLYQMALYIGFDTVACLYGYPCYVSGMGEEITPSPSFNIRQPILLICPCVPVHSGEAYRNFREGNAPFSHSSRFKEGSLTFKDIIALQNDLTDVAIGIAPVIQEVLENLKSCAGNEVAKLCGSGPTCLGLFDTEENLHSAYLKLVENKEWWVKVAHVSL